MKQNAIRRIVIRAIEVFLLALSLYYLWFIFKKPFSIFESFVGLLLLATILGRASWLLYKRVPSSTLFAFTAFITFITKKVVADFVVTSEQELETTATSRLRGEEIARAAQELTKEAITYKNVHYESIEQTLSSKTLDCSSFVRRAIYSATNVDIGNIKSDGFATSASFESFICATQALPGDIVQIRGHVAICQDQECHLIGEAVSPKIGLVIRATANSAIGSTKSPVTFYRLK